MKGIRLWLWPRWY